MFKEVQVREVNIKISNCLDCPHHKRYRSTPTGDSFDAADEDIVCTIAKGTHKCYDGEVKGQAMSVSERWPRRQREECQIPKWCPLLMKDKS